MKKSLLMCTLLVGTCSAAVHIPDPTVTKLSKEFEQLKGKDSESVKKRTKGLSELEKAIGAFKEKVEKLSRDVEEERQEHLKQSKK